MDGIFSRNNSRFIDFFDRIYLPELELKRTTNSDRSTSYLERIFFSIKDMISIFTLRIFHLYVATFQQHLQMDYTSLSWSDVRFMRMVFVNLVILYRICVANAHWCVRFVLIAGHFFCTSLMTYHKVWYITDWWRNQHDECHLWNMTLFNILSFCV